MSARSLAVALGVSRATAMRALRELVERGFLEVVTSRQLLMQGEAGDGIPGDATPLRRDRRNPVEGVHALAGR